MNSSLMAKASRFNIKKMSFTTATTVLFIAIISLCFSAMADRCPDCNQPMEPPPGASHSGEEYCRRCDEYSKARIEILECLEKCDKSIKGIFENPPQATAKYKAATDQTKSPVGVGIGNIEGLKDLFLAQHASEITLRRTTLPATPYLPFHHALTLIPLYHRINPHMEFTSSNIIQAHMLALAHTLRNVRPQNQLNYNRVLHYTMETLYIFDRESQIADYPIDILRLYLSTPHYRFTPDYCTFEEISYSGPSTDELFDRRLRDTLNNRKIFYCLINGQFIVVVRSQPRPTDGSYTDYYILSYPALIISVASENESPRLTTFLNMMAADREHVRHVGNFASYLISLQTLIGSTRSLGDALFREAILSGQPEVEPGQIGAMEVPDPEQLISRIMTEATETITQIPAPGESSPDSEATASGQVPTASHSPSQDPEATLDELQDPGLDSIPQAQELEPQQDCTPVAVASLLALFQILTLQYAPTSSP